jgi:hypothetical protein
MKNVTYNQVINLLETTARAHKMVSEFGEGAVSNLTVIKDFAYPLVWAVEDHMVQPINKDGNFQQGEWKINLLCMDLVSKDESNRREVKSDSLGILMDICNYVQT